MYPVKDLLVRRRTLGLSEKRPSAEMIEKLRSYEELPERREQDGLQKLTYEKVKRALIEINLEFVAINCWKCPDEGHSAFKCS